MLYRCLSSPRGDTLNYLLGPPMDPDEDSDNSSVYVQGLNDNVTLEDLADFFKQCGVVKVRGNTGERGCPPPPAPPSSPFSPSSPGAGGSLGGWTCTAGC